MKTLVTLMLFAVLTASAATDPPPNPINDRWSRVRFLVGSWEGTASGQPGKGTVERTYEVVLGGQFIEEHSTSRYEAKAPGAKPEVHHHRGFIRFDKARESYEVISPDEFVEIFELAEPGKDFVEYSRNHFKRKK